MVTIPTALQRTFKIILLGQSGTGKTAVFHRLMGQPLSHKKYTATKQRM